VKKNEKKTTFNNTATIKRYYLGNVFIYYSLIHCYVSYNGPVKMLPRQVKIGKRNLEYFLHGF